MGAADSHPALGPNSKAMRITKLKALRIGVLDWLCVTPTYEVRS
ncbi:hypothetical protein [Pseudomonas serbica]